MRVQFKTDQDLIQAFTSGSAPLVNAAMKQLYLDGALFGAVCQQIKKLGGNTDDAREMLGLALIELDKKVRQNEYDPTKSKINTYVTAIARQLFFTRKRSEYRRQAAHERAHSQDTLHTIHPDHLMERQHRRQLLQDVLRQLGDKCQQLLQLYALEFSMAEIAQKIGYKTPDSAKMAVADCRKKAHQFLIGKPQLLKELLEI